MSTHQIVTVEPGRVPVTRGGVEAVDAASASPAATTRGPWVDRLPFPEQARRYTARHIANKAGVNRATITRWRSLGVPHINADRLADALNLHPLNIWGDAYLNAGNTCHRGHPWDGDTYDSDGKRRCPVCLKAAEARRKAS